MNGLYFDFELNDIVIGANGSFDETLIDNQNCALIAVSEICRLTTPEVGERLGAKIVNRKQGSVAADIASAVRAVERDGGKRVQIIQTGEDLQFIAHYED